MCYAARPMVFRYKRLGPVLTAAVVFLGLAAQRVQAQPAEPEDRVLAVVDGDPILKSDLDQLLGLGLTAPDEGETEAQLRRRLLDAMVEQKLRFHEMDRFGFSEIPVEEVEHQFELIRKRFEDPSVFTRRLAAVGLDKPGLRQLLARQIMVLTYVDERLGPRVFVSLDDIRAYYNAEFVPAMEQRGEEIPALEKVREEIRGLIQETRLNEEIVSWTAELRLEADVIDYLDSRHESLPALIAPPKQQRAKQRAD